MGATLTEKVLDSYIKNMMQSLEPIVKPDEISRKIEECNTPEELHRLMAEAGLTASTSSETLEWDEYAPNYARKRARSQSREEQLKEKEEFEGLGEPFTPPISTEDVTGL